MSLCMSELFPKWFMVLVWMEETIIHNEIKLTFCKPSNWYQTRKPGAQYKLVLLYYMYMSEKEKNLLINYFTSDTITYHKPQYVYTICEQIFVVSFRSAKYQYLCGYWNFAERNGAAWTTLLLILFYFWDHSWKNYSFLFHNFGNVLCLHNK